MLLWDHNLIICLVVFKTLTMYVSQDDPGQVSHHKYKAVSQILFQNPSFGLSSNIAEFFSMY